MKVKALMEGFDGKSHYEAGDTLSEVHSHCRMLLFNGAAEPLDAEAKKFVADNEGMSDKDRKAHSLNNQAIRDNVANIDHSRSAKGRKGAKKTVKSKKRK